MAALAALAAWAAVAAVAVAPSDARADEFEATLGQPLREVSHAVDVSFADGVATMRVQRVFANAGTRADEAWLDIELPPGAAVTGLRIRARKRWYRGELMERDKAAALYEKLTGMGPHEPRDPALLQWSWAGRVQLQVFPVLPGKTSTVEYTLTVPTSYANGRYAVAYPRPADLTALTRPILRVDPGHGDAATAVAVDGQPVSPGAPIVLNPPAALPWVGRGAAEPGVGYAISGIDVTESGAAARAVVTYAIDHTYRGDLAIALVTPAGEHLPVVRGESSENDLRGERAIELPQGTPIVGRWHLVVSDHAALDTGKLTNWSIRFEPPSPPTPRKSTERPVVGASAERGEQRARIRTITYTATDTPRFIPDASPDNRAFAVIEAEPPAIATAASRLGRVVASPAHGFSRLEIDVAPELRPLPKAPSVVFVIDASHSIGQAGIDAQIALARAYLSHVPDARADIVVYRRFAHRLVGELVTADALNAAIEVARVGGRLRPGNGSAIDLGLRAAADAVGKRRGPQRIVATSDALVRTGLAPRHAIAALRAAPRAIVHVVIPELDTGKLAEQRDDQHPLAPIAAARRGVLLEMTGLGGRSPEALRGVTLGLVRPIRIDNAAVAGLDPDADEVPQTLAEGTGYRVMLEAAKPPQQVTLTGAIWGEPFRRVIRAGAAFDRATAAFVFGEDEHGELSEAEMMTVARQGRAVSPVTSYLAIEPGVRPSRIGIERGSGLGTIGHGSGSGVGYGRGGTLNIYPRVADLMDASVARCEASHRPGPGWSAQFDVELTYHEIVNVQFTSGAQGANNARNAQTAHDAQNTKTAQTSQRGSLSSAMTRCLTEALWSLSLPRASFHRSRHREIVILPR